MGAREISRIDIQTSFTSDELGIFFAALINIHDIFPFAAIVESSSWHNKLRSGRTQLGSTWRRSLSSFSLTRLAARSFTSEMGNLTHFLFQPIRRKILKNQFRLPTQVYLRAHVRLQLRINLGSPHKLGQLSSIIPHMYIV